MLKAKTAKRDISHRENPPWRGPLPGLFDAKGRSNSMGPGRENGRAVGLFTCATGNNGGRTYHSGNAYLRTARLSTRQLTSGVGLPSARCVGRAESFGNAQPGFHCAGESWQVDRFDRTGAQRQSSSFTMKKADAALASALRHLRAGAFTQIVAHFQSVVALFTFRAYALAQPDFHNRFGLLALTGLHA